MIGRVYAIALNTFRDAVRQRVPYGVLFVAVAVNLVGLALMTLPFNTEQRIGVDFGLLGVSLFGSITAVILGVTQLYNEIQKRTIHSIVSKPLARWEFVLGKYLGMAITLSMLVALFVGFMMAVLAMLRLSIDETLIQAVVLAYIEVLVVAAIAIFFSAFSTPFLSGIFAFSVFVIGRLTPWIREAMADHNHGLIGGLYRTVLRVVPDLHLLSVSGRALDGKHVSVHGEFVDWSYVALAAGHGVLWISILMILAMGIFSRRDFA